MKTEDYIYEGDGLNVTLDGEKVPFAFYADTHHGIVKHYGNPPQVNCSGDGFIMRISHGVVTVEARSD